MADCQVPIRLRPMRETDRAFITSCWLRSSADLPNHRWVPWVIVCRDMSPRIDAWLNRYPCLVATARSDTDMLLGFLCWSADPLVIQFAYVRESVRRMGVAKAMLEHAQYPADTALPCTHWSQACEDICRNYPELQYRPSLLRDPRRREQKKNAQRRSQERAARSS